MSVEWSWLCQNGKDIQSLMGEVSSQMEPAKTLISAFDYRHLCSSHRTENFYILSRFIKVTSFLCETENGLQLKAEFEDVSDGGVNDHSGALFSVTFFKDAASKLYKFISGKKLVTGNLVHFVQPWVLSDEENGPSLLVTSAASPKQVVHLWRQHSDLFIDSFELFSDSSYKHATFYGYDGTGSMGHAMLNMLKLIEGKGIVTSLDKISVKECPQKFVAVAEFKKLECPLKVCEGTKEIQISFRVVFNSFSTSVKAYLFDSIACELQQMLENKHLEPGDLVAICQPILQYKTAAIVGMRFPLDTKICLVILKDQHKKTALRFQFKNHQLPHNIGDSSDNFVKLNEKLSFNIERFDTLLFNHLNKDKDIFTCFIEELKKRENILSLNSFAGKLTLQNFNDFVILSCILKVVVPLKETNHKKRAVIFSRELGVSGELGCFFKTVLHDNFAEKMCLAMQEKQIIKGDVIAFVNPCVLANPSFVPQSFQDEEPFLLEITPKRKNQKINVYKIKGIDTYKPKTTILAKYSKSLSEDCFVCTKNKSSEIKTNDITTVMTNDNSNSQVTNDKIHSECGSTTFEASSSNSNLKASKKRGQVEELTNIKINKNQTNKLKKNNVELCLNRDDLSIFPYKIEKPNTKDELDFVSGYCYLSCRKMYTYTVLKINVQNTPLCPKCLVEVRLKLCLQLVGVSRNERDVCALLVGKYAERFLQITCSEYLNDSEKRNSALESLKCKLTQGKSQTDGSKIIYELDLSNVTHWWFKSQKQKL